MKRYRFLVALSFALPVAPALCERSALSWQPVEVAHFNAGDATVSLSVEKHSAAVTTYKHFIGLPPNYLPTSAPKTISTFFNFQKGTTQKFVWNGENNVGLQNGFLWHEQSSVRAGENFALTIRDDRGQEKVFSCVCSDHESINNQQLRILPEQNRVVLLGWKAIYQWNWKEAKTTKRRTVGGHIIGTLARDGRTFMCADSVGFSKGNIIKEKIRRINGDIDHHLEQVKFSPYGAYALHDQPTQRDGWEVMETTTGKSLWQFSLSSSVSLSWAISDDEQTIFIPQTNQWEVRDLKTGAILRRLPLVPDTSAVASSPDGSTLYSVAGGVLYRQRAR